MATFSSKTKNAIKRAVLRTLESKCNVYTKTATDTSFGQEEVDLLKYNQIPCRLGRIRPDETLKAQVIIDRRLFHLFLEGDKILADSDEILLDNIRYEVESFMGEIPDNDYLGRAVITRLGG